MDSEISNLQTPETEPITPTRIQPPQPANGALRRHPPIHINHFRHPSVVTYKECHNNFAASIGGHNVDGCGEFILSPTSNLSDPQSLLCDVCGCHRNFHRRDEEYSFPHPLVPRNNHVQIERYAQDRSEESTQTISSFDPHMLMEPSHGPGTVLANLNMHGVRVSRKRFRTKFTQDQKEKMMKVAEKVGWKMQTINEIVINESCKDIGVDKRVFKVWMKNYKNNVCKKDTTNNSIASVASPPIIMTNNVVNSVGVSEGKLESGFASGEGDLGTEDHVPIEEKEHEDNVVACTNDGSSPSATIWF